MAHCAVCGKSKSVGNNVSHANNRTKRTVRPNLQKAKISTSTGAVIKTSVCTRCIRSGKTL